MQEITPGELIHALTIGKFVDNGLYKQPREGQKKYTLTSPQRSAYDDIIRDLNKGNYGGFVERPTGTGKTILLGSVLRALDPLLKKKAPTMSGKPCGSLILVHSRDMARQTRNELIKKCGIAANDIASYDATIASPYPGSRHEEEEDPVDYDGGMVPDELSAAEEHYFRTQRATTEVEDAATGHGYFVRQHKGIGHNRSNPTYLQKVLGKRHLILTYAAFNSFCNRGIIDPENRPVIILDEADLSKGEMTSSRLREFARDAYVLGFTATERYLHPSGRLYSASQEIVGRDDLIHCTTISQALENGEIIPIDDRKIVLDYTSDIQDSGVYEFTSSQLQKIADQEGRNAAAIEAVQEEVPNIRAKPQLWYASTIAQAREVAAQLNTRYGRAYAVAVDGTTSDRELASVFYDFAQGKVKAIVSANLLIRGKDLPHAEVAVNLRPSRSPTLVTQMAGRIMRKDKNNPDKKGIFLQVMNKDLQNVVTFDTLRDGSFFAMHDQRAEQRREAAQAKAASTVNDDKEKKATVTAPPAPLPSGDGHVEETPEEANDALPPLMAFRAELAKLLKNHPPFEGRNDAEIATRINCIVEAGEKITEADIAAWRNGEGTLPAESVIDAITAIGKMPDWFAFSQRWKKAAQEEAALGKGETGEEKEETPQPLHIQGKATAAFSDILYKDADRVTLHGPEHPFTESEEDKTPDSLRASAGRVFLEKLAAMLNDTLPFEGKKPSGVAALVNRKLGESIINEKQVAQWRNKNGALPEENVLYAITELCPSDSGWMDLIDAWEAAVGKIPAVPPSPDTLCGERKEELPLPTPAVRGTQASALVSDSPVRQEIANILNGRRAFFGRSNAFVAERVNAHHGNGGVSAEQIADWRAGRGSLPSVEDVAGIADAVKMQIGPKARLMRAAAQACSAADAAQSYGARHGSHADAVRGRRAEERAAQR